MHRLPVDPKLLVTQGYDRIGEVYSHWTKEVRTEERARYTDLLLNRLPPGAAVLDLGCGVGVHTTEQLARRFQVTGVDLSPIAVAVARKQVPQARFVVGDMSQIGFAPASFDGVAAFYSVIHVPREEQPELLRRINAWLRPGGVFVGTLSARASEATVAVNWLGAPMFWSGFDAKSNRTMVEAAGFLIERATEETANEFGEPVTFLWVVACKPDPDLR